MARSTRGQARQVHINLNLALGDTHLVSPDSITGVAHQRIKRQHGSKTTRQKRSWDPTSINLDPGSASRKRGTAAPGLLGILIGAADRVIRMWASMPRK